MPKFDSPLNNVHIASPCPANWDEMYGDDKKRFCAECKLNVYNLSGMTRDEAERLVTNHEGRLCVSFYRRADGTIITADCPVGWAKFKQRTRLYATAAASLVIALFTGVLFVSLFSKSKPTIGDLRLPFPVRTPERIAGGIMPIPPKNTNTNVNKPTTDVNRKSPEPSPSRFEMGKVKVLDGDALRRQG